MADNGGCMDVFELRENLIKNYKEYVLSFTNFADERIGDFVADELKKEALWKSPRISLNPQFERGQTINNLIERGLLHPDNEKIFRFGKSSTNFEGKPNTELYRHQVKAIQAARNNENYVVTTGTGSGKSLTYIVPIVDHILRNGSSQGIKAIIVYPMNALVNSQKEELKKFIDFSDNLSNKPRYFSYTGQTAQVDREELIKNGTDILLTNYVMLEYILTRHRDKEIVEQFKNLQFVVLDELHSYRGRQGADIALLIRRLRVLSGSANLQCIGTSATLSTEGGRDNQLQSLAKISSQIFGDKVKAESIINETVYPLTNPDNFNKKENEPKLQKIVQQSSPPNSLVDFKNDVFASWLESKLSVEKEGEDFIRKSPIALEEIVSELEKITGLEGQQCLTAIKSYLMVEYLDQSTQKRRAPFAFRLHQFISGGDNVYASLEDQSHRRFSMLPQDISSGDRLKKLFPLAFCRICGQDYYLVDFSEENKEFRPRRIYDNKNFEQDNEQSGFIYANSDYPWPQLGDEIIERLPDEWLDGQNNSIIKKQYRDRVPQLKIINQDGIEVDPSSGDDSKLGCWWFPTPFHFCLKCGTSHSVRTRSKDFNRLSVLVAGGRSSVTTILSLFIIRYLQEGNVGLAEDSRKLLSFSDNRQDASFQAGHLNDFVEVVMIRTALYRALKSNGTISQAELPMEVFKALKLDFATFADNPDIVGSAVAETEKVFRDVLSYRIYNDLERGWRPNQPNLEQTGLLKIDYSGLNELSSDESIWQKSHTALKNISSDKRLEIMRVLLDHMRRKLGINIDVFSEQEILKRRASQRLSGSWSLEDEKPKRPVYFSTTSQSKQFNRYKVFPITARSSFGNYLKKAEDLRPFVGSNDDVTQIIEDLFNNLAKYNILAKKQNNDSENYIWQIVADSMIWQVGDGSSGYSDPLSASYRSEIDIPTNDFFVKLYKGSVLSSGKVKAKEHTAQVSNEDRQQREKDFRSGILPILYCSPTMELGIDIASLNVVYMRNVPPSPANYVQRSGRAGRDGQSALVVTYCATASNHDQYFFRQPNEMISGRVKAPRVDLLNKQLIESHIHSIWLHISGINLKTSMMDILENPDELIFQPSIRHALTTEKHKNIAKTRRVALQVLSSIDGLEKAPWWSEGWLENTLNRIDRDFKEAAKRWVELFKAAKAQLERQNKQLQQLNLASNEREQASYLHTQANQLMKSLDTKRGSQHQSDFYTYRYFATEGFLPGYSFPRLPLSALVSGRKDKSTSYLQRPRFIAMTEFGPQSFIYHDGAKYQVDRLLSSGEVNTSNLRTNDDGWPTASVKKCGYCGCVHEINESSFVDVCTHCQRSLEPAWGNLLQMRNVITRKRGSITSEEEDRDRRGYNIVYGFEFSKRGGEQSVKTAQLRVKPREDEEGFDYLKLTYAETPTIWSFNLGWRSRPDENGFNLNVKTGEWLSGKETKPNLEIATKSVIPYTSDTCNALIITPIDKSWDQSVMSSVAAALKVAIERQYQLESQELIVEPLPDKDKRQQLLLYESAEGGAGALRQLIDDINQWRKLVRLAIDQCHVDPNTLEDKVDESVCPRSCYNCLFSYDNQFEHDLLDRKLAVEYLAPILKADFNNSENNKDIRATSSLEQDFIQFLKSNKYRLPSRSQVLFSDFNARPDFVYDEEHAIIYIDGPHHNLKDRQKDDESANQRFKEAGYTVLRFDYKTKSEWGDIIAKYPSIFGRGREG